MGRPKSGRTCSFQGCEKKHCARGLCNAHWQQQRHGWELRPLRVHPTKCDYPGCSDKHYGRNLCKTHFERIWKNGLTLNEYLDRLSEQRGTCAVCGSEEPGGKGYWHVDHDHSCCSTPARSACGSCVRGLLCHHCNVGLGNFKDDVDLLIGAVNYLRRWQTKNGVGLQDGS